MSYVNDRDLADSLKSKAAARKKSQRDLAQELGISEAYLSDFLNGRRSAGPTILRRLGYDPTPYYKKAGKAAAETAPSTDKGLFD